MLYRPKQWIQRIEQLARRPQHPGKEFVIARTTYEALYDMAADIRRSLSLHGQPDTVCLFTKDKVLFMATLLAGLAGNFSVVLPYAQSPRVLSTLHGITEYGVAVCDQPQGFPPGVAVLTPAGMGTLDPAADPPSDVNPQAAWVKLFTGGSTGRPQLCSKAPQNLLGEALYLREKFAISSKDRIVAAVPPYHIYGLLYSILLPFVASAAVLGERPVFPQEIGRAVEKHRATVLVAAPIHLRALRRRLSQRGLLRLAFSSASMLEEKDNGVFCRQTGAEIFEVYGSTETGGVASRCRARGQAGFQVFHGIDWKVDEGHLFVRSGFMSPEPARDSDGYVKVGDRVRRMDDERFLLLGRSDGIIKVAGQRVDLYEIRETIKKIEGVRDAVVKALPQPGGRENKIAAVVAGAVEKKNILGVLSDQLEAYALPRRIKIVKNIPFTDTGKVDRKAVDRLMTPKGKSVRSDKTPA